MDLQTEYLLKVHGTSGIVDGLHGITSLTFTTNKSTYGPYGSVCGRKFQSLQGGKVVGFFGQASHILNQIGVVTILFPQTNSTHCTHSKCHHINGHASQTIIGTPIRKGSRQVIFQNSMTNVENKREFNHDETVGQQTPGTLKVLNNSKSTNQAESRETTHHKQELKTDTLYDIKPANLIPQAPDHSIHDTINFKETRPSAKSTQKKDHTIQKVRHQNLSNKTLQDIQIKQYPN